VGRSKSIHIVWTKCGSDLNKPHMPTLPLYFQVCRKTNFI